VLVVSYLLCFFCFYIVRRFKRSIDYKIQKNICNRGGCKVKREARKEKIMKHNQFSIGNVVTVKSKKYPMTIIGNVPNDGLKITDYLETDIYECQWQTLERVEVGIFRGEELELYAKG
jgi:uncharacterized protein YodC (DUF2158 family)